MKADRRGCPPSPGRGRRARPAPVGRRSRTPAGGRRRRRDPRAWAGRGGLGASEWVEPQLFELMDHPDIAHRDLSSLRAITHAGASAPPTLRRRARERLGAVLAHVYGASETDIVSALSPAEHDLARPNLFSCAGGIPPASTSGSAVTTARSPIWGRPGASRCASPPWPAATATPRICTQTCGPPGQARKGATEPNELCPPSRPDPDTNAKTIRSWPASAIRRGCACEGHG